jgi:hypothetical protein
LQEVEEQQLRRCGHGMRMEACRSAKPAGEEEARQTNQYMEEWDYRQQENKKPEGWRMFRSRTLEEKIILWFEEN